MVFEFNKNCVNRGFSLLELLVGITIVTIIGGIYLINYRTMDEDFALERSSYQLAQDIRRAQNMAMSSKEGSGEGFVGGYGIYLTESSDQYVLFRDADGSQNYDPLQDQAIETNKFEKGVVVTEIIFNPIVLTDIVSIVFAPPDPKVFFNTGGDQNRNQLSLKISINGKNSEVLVNKAGLISIIK